MTYLEAILNTSVVQAAAITALVEATAGIILFTTPTNTWHICAYSFIARIMKFFRLTRKSAHGSSTIHPFTGSIPPLKFEQLFRYKVEGNILTRYTILA